MIGRFLRWTGLTRPAFLIGLTLGLVGGAGGMLIGFPYLFPPQPLNEARPAEATGLAEGIRASIPFRFDEAAPARDFLHWANGTGAIIRTEDGYKLHLSADFSAAPGPDYVLYLTTRPITGKPDFAADQGKLELVKLKAFSGSQNYALPNEVGGTPFDPARFHAVTIWCRAFNAYIGTALLEK